MLHIHNKSQTICKFLNAKVNTKLLNVKNNLGCVEATFTSKRSS